VAGHKARMVKQLLDAGEAAEEALAYSCFVEGLMD
jgi:hypothetical protein